jgi:hypothetical protein
MIVTIEMIYKQISDLEKIVNNNQSAYLESLGALKCMINLKKHLETQEPGIVKEG